MTRSYCAVYGCLNSSVTKPELSFFRLPADFERRYQWLRLIAREELMNRSPRNSLVCEEHFNSMDILAGKYRRKLKTNSLPSLQLPNLQKKDEETLTEAPKLVEICTQTEENVILSTSSGAEPSISTKTPQAPQLAQSPRSKCSLCSKNFSGFVFACVQCNVRVCGACDARGAHARHYVLRAPSDGLEEQLTEVLSKVRAAVLSAGLAQPSRSPKLEDQPEAESEGEEEGDTDDEESEIILKSEIKEELYWSGSEDPLASSEYEEAFARDSTHSAAASQIVPAPDNVKQEPPGDGSAILDTGCDVTNTEQPSRRQTVTSNDSEDQPLAKRRRSNSTNTDGNVLQDVMILKTEGNKKNTDPNSNPGSPTVAGSLTRRKKE